MKSNQFALGDRVKWRFTAKNGPPELKRCIKKFLDPGGWVKALYVKAFVEVYRYGRFSLLGSQDWIKVEDRSGKTLIVPQHYLQKYN